jgi:hypothetical protein
MNRTSSCCFDLCQESGSLPTLPESTDYLVNFTLSQALHSKFNFLVTALENLSFAATAVNVLEPQFA